MFLSKKLSETEMLTRLKSYSISLMVQLLQFGNQTVMSKCGYLQRRGGWRGIESTWWLKCILSPWLRFWKTKENVPVMNVRGLYISTLWARDRDRQKTTQDAGKDTTAKKIASTWPVNESRTEKSAQPDSWLNTASNLQSHISFLKESHFSRI